MIVNVIEPSAGTLLDCACGSGGMFVQTGDFVNQAGMSANKSMTFFGQEKVEYNAKLCLMNMAVHGLTGVIKSGDEANTFYHDAHNLAGCCEILSCKLIQCFTNHNRETPWNQALWKVACFFHIRCLSSRSGKP